MVRRLVRRELLQGESGRRSTGTGRRLVPRDPRRLILLRASLLPRRLPRQGPPRLRQLRSRLSRRAGAVGPRPILVLRLDIRRSPFGAHPRELAPIQRRGATGPLGVASAGNDGGHVVVP